MIDKRIHAGFWNLGSLGSFILLAITAQMGNNLVEKNQFTQN